MGRPSGPVGTYYENEASARNSTVLNVMTQDLSTLSNLIAGTDDDVAASLTQQSNLLLGQIAGNKPDVINPTDTLFTAIRKLDERLTQTGGELQTTQSELASKEAEVSSLQEQLKSTGDLFEQQVKQLSDQHDQDRQRYAEQIADKEKTARRHPAQARRARSAAFAGAA